MPKKLYEVEVTGVIMVAADSAHDAEQMAKSYLSDEIDNLHYLPRRVSGSGATEWRDSIPYGSPNDQRCKDYE